MSRREDSKKRSLADLARIADKAAQMPWLDRSAKAAAPAPQARRGERVLPTPAPPTPSAAPAPPALAARRKQQQERREKLEEERKLKARRAAELQKGKTLEWRGMDRGDVPTGIRRTPFDRVEPNVSQKISDVLGDAKQKASREKARAKGKRQGGR